MTKPKVISFYLPQYHSIPENDDWWGKGFTDWQNVKNAKQYYKNHLQPRVPLNKNYYNLLDKEQMSKQFEIASNYGVDGFCYYHYWFNGKLLLEKPLENMLHIDNRIDYFFCWANEPWTRAWDGKTKDVLIDQNYGDVESWDNHFNYLLTFFCDSHYIKVDNKPVFVIYRTNNVPQCSEMVKYFNKKCIEHGFNGLYFIEELNSFQQFSIIKESDAALYFEPMYSLTFDIKKSTTLKNILLKLYMNCRYKSDIEFFSYDSIYKRILCRDLRSTKDQFYGAFIDWDNTPRKKKKGSVCYNASASAFKKYFSAIYEKSKKFDKKFIFINAWNEWAEGAYLEPDQKNGYSYLEAIKEITDNGDKDEDK